MAADARQQMLCNAFSDKHSAAYQGMMRVLRDCEAAEARAKANQPYVVVPFNVEVLDVAALERQFGIAIKVRGNHIRICATPLVAGMMFLLDNALLEHAGGCGRTVMMIDGDLMTVAALGAERRLVERTNATPRLSTGYFLEDDQLRRYSTGRGGDINVTADMLLREQVAGGGEHYWPKIREDGPKVDSLVVNHFKTPVGPRQLAWLAYKRGAMVYGAIPFQFDMLLRTEGELECFPGKYYIDKQADVMTLVPRSDATKSISHPYSSWLDIVNRNVIVVDGHTFLCEKYKSLTGIMYYTLKPVGDDFEAPEVLRTHYFDPALLSITEIKYPRVKLSEQGVPIGWERGSARIMTSRCEKVLSRLMTSANLVVTPVEAFTALMDYNNVVVNTLDTVKVAERMEVDDENELALALALHVNWTRHAARGTFNVLMNAIKTRYSVADAMLYKFAFIALSAWWTKPRVHDEVVVDELPVTKVVDWCGNDFSVVMEDADAWIEVVEVAGGNPETYSKEFSWFPRTKGKGSWYMDILQKAQSAVSSTASSSSTMLSTVTKVAKVAAGSIKSNPCITLIPAARSVGPSITLVDQIDVRVTRPSHDLTAIKQLLGKKMRRDQGAVNEVVPDRYLATYGQITSDSLPDVPVVEVEPMSAMRDDIIMCNKGVFERDVVTTGYRIAEIDIDKRTEGEFSINDSKRAIPKARWVRYPKVDAGVEGKRVTSQAALMGAIFKRNIGIPSNRGSVDLEAFPYMAVEKVIQVCYRENWQEILNEHLMSGLWEPNGPDIDNFLGNLDEKKTRTLLNEFFMEGTVTLDRWLLMAKGKIKASRESDANSKVDHSQTIMYLENSSTNAMYSAMTRRFKESIDACLRPEISLNPQCSDAEHEDWYNSLESIRKSHAKTYSYNADIKCYDRSQEHVALRIDLEFYRRHGLNQDRLKIWEQTHGPKRAVSMMFGVVLTMVLGGVSGLWKTLMRNGIVNLAATIVSTNVSRSDIVMLDIKGDDLDAEFARPVKVETAVERMSLTFNLSAKFFTSDVRYMCKSFRIKTHGRWYFVADPWARSQSACTPVWIGNEEDNLHERWVSLGADLRHYQNGILVDLVAEAAQQFYGTERPLYGMARALSALMSSKTKYFNFFNPPKLVN